MAWRTVVRQVPFAEEGSGATSPSRADTLPRHANLRDPAVGVEGELELPGVVGEAGTVDAPPLGSLRSPFEEVESIERAGQGEEALHGADAAADDVGAGIEAGGVGGDSPDQVSEERGDAGLAVGNRGVSSWVADGSAGRATSCAIMGGLATLQLSNTTTVSC